MQHPTVSQPSQFRQLFYLLRHGHIDTGRAGRLIGQTDLPLSQQGVSQARAWLTFFGETPPACIYCSDLTRARQTAATIVNGGKAPLHILPELREIRLGQWDGLTRQEIEVAFPGGWRRRGANMADYRPPGGESFTDLARRVVPAFTAIAEAGHIAALIITHAGVIRVIIAHLLGMPMAGVFKMACDYGRAAVVDKQHNAFTLRALNAAPQALAADE